MTIVVFGLTISSAWGNGHATLWRGLCRALGELGHQVVFFEHDVPYYAAHRDLIEPEGCELVLYSDWSTVRPRARRLLDEADVAMVTSYCPDGQAASALVLESRAPIKVFYDLDTPVTLERLALGQRVSYLPDDGLGGFNLVLSYTGGRALDELKRTLGARTVAPLYGSVDPDHHYPVDPDHSLHSDLSYLGTYALDRQEVLQRLFIDAARRRPALRFAIAGSQYPEHFPWEPNIFYLFHLPPSMHPAFYCSSGLTLNVTRGPMAGMGFCPSGRLFEAAACGAPLLSDWWEGLDTFFEPGREIFIADSTEAVLDALDTSPECRARVAAAARERALTHHSSRARAQELVGLLDGGAPAIAIDARDTRTSETHRQEVV